MIILSEENLPAYIKDILASKLDFIADAKVQNVAVAGGGLVSAVFKAQVDGKNLYFGPLEGIIGQICCFSPSAGEKLAKLEKMT